MKEEDGLVVLYVLGDGDRIRERLETALLSSDLEELARISAAITAAVAALAEEAVSRLAASLVLAGGDDVVFTVASDKFEPAALERIGRSFTRRTGCTISFGVGRSTGEAYLALRRAKARGGGSVVVEAGA